MSALSDLSAAREALAAGRPNEAKVRANGAALRALADYRAGRIDRETARRAIDEATETALAARARIGN